MVHVHFQTGTLIHQGVSNTFLYLVNYS